MHILLVDRHPVPRFGFATLLRASLDGASVVELENVETALKMIRSEHADLLLCGRSTGAALGPDWMSKLVKAARPGRVITLAGRLDAFSCELARNAGMAGQLPITASADLVLAAIRLILAGGTYFPTIDATAPGREGPTPFENSKDKFALTKRQRQVLTLVEQGLPNTKIASALGISAATVKLHVQAVLRALDVKNRTEAARVARDHALVG